MAFNYKNPISSVQVNTPNSVLSTDTFGTNFSVLQVGGYMEVWNLDDLIYSAYGQEIFLILQIQFLYLSM